jgi:23S rRNA (pseudouridine1915-N3)-methyltransferase
VRFVVLAVGTKMPAWVDQAFGDYARRLSKPWRLELVEIRAEPRTEGKPVAAMMRAEATRLSAALPPGSFRVALDEHGRELTSQALARWVDERQVEQRDIAFLIGGPDGLDPELLAGANLKLRLSAFTLPHALARVVIAEQLYRAVTILNGHPYHRE